MQTSPRRQNLPGGPAVTTLGSEQAAGSEPERMLARCRMGDTAAWDELVARYEWLVFSVARRNGLSREDAADVTQTTFLALLESLETIHAEDRLASWLMTVSRRQSWALRNRALREAPGADVTADRVDDHDPVACWEELTVLHDALDGLAKPCRDLLRALYLDPTEPSYREVADRFGFRIGGIGPMRARCLRRLRHNLGEDVFA